jgi:tRNA nucleotidyltransferase (CCA-adding enzyme)
LTSHGKDPIQDTATEGLDVYIVGGAVRDALLGLHAGDRDWVVVGATPQEMAKRGFIPVGGDFPVFLHPRSKEEYALARTERKSGKGYKGFTFYTGTDVTLEDDLQRRDLTVNAIAQTPDGRLVDPLNGQSDIKHKVLRHVGLRLARFAARFHDFSIAPETLALGRRLVEDGEVDALVPERVWREVAKGLMSDHAGRMFQVLESTGALSRVLPGLMFDEEKAGIELSCAAAKGMSLAARFALACRLSDDPAGIGRQVRAPVECQDYARLLPVVLAAVEHDAAKQPAGWLHLMERCDALRKPDRFLELLDAASCAAKVDSQAWRARMDAVRAVDAGAIAKTLQGQPARIKQAVHEARLAALQHVS